MTKTAFESKHEPCSGRNYGAMCYSGNMDIKARIEKDFTYHRPTEEQASRMQKIRDTAKELAILVADSTPASREQSLALTSLEEVSMWANAAIARNE